MKVRRTVVVAPFWRRGLADLLDLLVLTAAGYGLRFGGAFSPELPPRRYDWFDYLAELLGDHLALFKPSLGLAVAMGVLYALIFRQVLGRTPGEWALGLRLVDRDGLVVGPFETLLHSVGTVLGLALLLLGYVWAAVDLKRQGLAEYLSRTMLIYGSPQVDRLPTPAPDPFAGLPPSRGPDAPTVETAVPDWYATPPDDA